METALMCDWNERMKPRFRTSEDGEDGAAVHVQEDISNLTEQGLMGHKYEHNCFAAIEF